MNKKTPLPSKEQILEYIQLNPDNISKREIARAFHIRGNDRIHLKKILKELADEGHISTGRTKKYKLPRFCVVEITSIDKGGDLIGTPQDENFSSVQVIIESKKAFNAKVGEFLLCRTKKVEGTTYHGKPVKKVTVQEKDFDLARVVKNTQQFHCVTLNRNAKSYSLPESLRDELEQGDVLKITPSPHAKQLKASQTKRIGNIDDIHILSELAIHEYNLPNVFSAKAIQETANLKVPPLGKREDLRDVHLVTIDGEDARDFDDAVWAEPDKKVKGGWHLIVAIADVAHYVEQGSALDLEASKRGNSVYFPDRVVPMLPEALSNDLCALKPDVERASFAVHLWVNEKGELTDHQFVRSLIKSHARLTYKEVEDLHKGGNAPPFLQNLYGAYETLKKYRQSRITLDFNRPETKIVFDKGQIFGIEEKPSYESHRLIEEFMVTANIAAARSLSEASVPGIYRVHPSPEFGKIEELRDTLKGFGLSLAKGININQKKLMEVLNLATNSAFEQQVNDAVLRAQCQAVYSHNNVGHFGLNLSHYSHFTSPIRRYSDLILHRLLLHSLKIEKLSPVPEDDDLSFLSESLSLLERRAAKAEWDTIDRFIAGFMHDKVGSEFEGYIAGLTKHGLYIALYDMKVEGFVPISSLQDDYYKFDDRNKQLVGRHSRNVIKLGQTVHVKLVEADPFSKSLIFNLLGLPSKNPAVKKKKNNKKRK